MIISDEQVRRAVEYLRTSDEYEGGGYGDAAVSQEFVTRVTEALEEVPDVRTERVAEARERVPEAALRAAVLATPTPPPLRLGPHGFDVIAELKLRSAGIFDHFHTGSYGSDSELRDDLAPIALRRARDWKRRFLRRRKQTDPIEDHPELDQVLPQADPDEGRRLREALDGLPERQRSALLLHEWMGYSFREIAESLGTSEATARVHCFRARETLRGKLAAPNASSVASRMQEQGS